MVNIKEFLIKSNMDFGSYALITYNGIIEATWIIKYNIGGEDLFLESPCELKKIRKINKPLDDFCKEYVNECVELEEENIEEYIEKFVKPMIIDNFLYEIEAFQCMPYLPEEVQDIKLISERECLEWMLKTEKNN